MYWIGWKNANEGGCKGRLIINNFEETHEEIIKRKLQTVENNLLNVEEKN